MPIRKRRTASRAPRPVGRTFAVLTYRRPEQHIGKERYASIRRAVQLLNGKHVSSRQDDGGLWIDEWECPVSQDDDVSRIAAVADEANLAVWYNEGAVVRPFAVGSGPVKAGRKPLSAREQERKDVVREMTRYDHVLRRLRIYSRIVLRRPLHPDWRMQADLFLSLLKEWEEAKRLDAVVRKLASCTDAGHRRTLEREYLRLAFSA